MNQAAPKAASGAVEAPEAVDVEDDALGAVVAEEEEDQRIQAMFECDLPHSRGRSTGR